jgi:hypothetical protein
MRTVEAARHADLVRNLEWKLALVSRWPSPFLSIKISDKLFYIFA